MNNVNYTEIIGYIAKDFQLRKTNVDDKSVVNMTIVTKEYIGKGKDHHVEWHNVVLWGQLAEYAAKYAAKGDLVRITGANRQKEWEDQDGNRRRSLEISANSFMIMKQKNDRNNKHEDDYSNATDEDAQSAHIKAVSKASSGNKTNFKKMRDDEDENSPF